MTQEEHATLFYRSLMAGVFAGIMATMANLAFDIGWRQYTAFPLSDLINVSSIIFATLIVLTIAGLSYYFIAKWIKSAVLVHIIVWVGLMAWAIRLAMTFQRSTNPVWSSDFRTLLIGIVIVTGAFAAFYVPFVVRKNKNVL